MTRRATALLAGWMGVAALMVGCASDPAPEPGDIERFDRLTAELVLDLTARPGLTRVRFFPGGRPDALLTRKAGEIIHVRLDGASFTELGMIALPDVRPSPGELGLTDVVFDPDFDNNGWVYACFGSSDNQRHRIVRFTWSDTYDSILESLVTILNVSRETPLDAWHSIYALAFLPDGKLYAAMGEATQPARSPDPQSLLGKLIRIEPRPEGGYAIPADNPYVGDPNTRDEIVARGLRSPFRMLAWRDLLFIGDVGGASEEINVFRGPPVHFGWPDCSGACDIPGLENPELDSPHASSLFELEDPEASTSTQIALALGVVYDVVGADPYDDLLDRYLLFNDIYQGYVRGAPVMDNGALGQSVHLLHHELIVSMDTGPDGFIYATTIWPATVVRLVLKPTSRARPSVDH